MPAIVELQDVIKDYPLGNISVRALHGVNLRIDKGEFTAIAGPSGSGKTTLLNLIGCVDIPTSGSVVVAGQNVEKLNPFGCRLDKLFERLILLQLLFFVFVFNGLLHPLPNRSTIR